MFQERFTQVEHGSRTYTAAHEQHLGIGRSRHGESVAQREHYVYCIAFLYSSQFTGTVAHELDEEPYFVFLSIYVVDGNGATQEGSRRTVHPDFGKLSRKHFGQGSLLRQLDENVVRVQASVLGDCQI